MKYKTVVIDPPWDMGRANWRTNRGGTLGRGVPYSTMTNQEIAEWPLRDYMDESCDVFTWTTARQLPATFDIIRAWGLKYASLIVWHKKNGVNMHGITNHTEYLVYAYRGRRGIDFHNPLCTYQTGRRRRHSEKPAEIYERIRIRTREPRIDIFARRRHPGFDAWGDQVEETVAQLTNLH